MKLEDTIERVPLDQIQVDRDNRQRRKIDTSDLIESVRQRGVYTPILVHRGSMLLVAGERRLTVSRELGLPDIPVRYFEDLDPVEAQIVELEENLKRQDLGWRDQTTAIAKLHSMRLAQDPEWSQRQTAEQLGLTPGAISQFLRVSRDINSPRISQAATLMAAYNTLSRIDSRKQDDVVADLISAGKDLFANVGAHPSQPRASASAPNPAGGTDPSPVSVPAPDVAPQSGLGDISVETFPPLAKPDPVSLESIVNVDFLEWAPNYTGRPFNFIHCDFPYGINVFGGKMSGRDGWTTDGSDTGAYKDDPEIYWALLGELCTNLDRIVSSSAHVMFWFSMEHYEVTLEFFRKHAPSLEFSKFPLVWTKTDNVGILPDPERGPRRIYETALIGSRGDRKIVKPISNAYGAPTDKAHHHSTKPVPVLKHFFQLFVDENTRLFDPTAGSGSALRAAEDMGAELVMGLEKDPEHYEIANRVLKQARVLRSAKK